MTETREFIRRAEGTARARVEDAEKQLERLRRMQRQLDEDIRSTISDVEAAYRALREIEGMADKLPVAV